MDWDPVRFTWVEEVGEMALAWLTLIGAAIGIRSRSHFTLYLITPYLARPLQRAIETFNHLVIAGIGALAAWHGVTLVKLNKDLATPGLEVSLGFLYGSAVVGGVLIMIYALSMIVALSAHDPMSGH
jgi:TRAP-type C4-dicarboxylate transport system permease small subunit